MGRDGGPPISAHLISSVTPFTCRKSKAVDRHYPQQNEFKQSLLASGRTFLDAGERQSPIKPNRSSPPSMSRIAVRGSQRFEFRTVSEYCSACVSRVGLSTK